MEKMGMHYRGLSAAEVVEQRKKFGPNVLTPPEKDPLWKQWLEKFEDPTIIILLVCAGIAFAVGLLEQNIPWDAVAILVAVGLATAGGTWSEYKADKAFELLKQDSDKIQVKVTREGQFHTISTTDLVVGDIIHLESGDKIPADAKVLHSVDLMVDEALMTGESDAVHRRPDDKLIGGTHIMTGNGIAEVIAVGDKTEMGNLASALGKGFICPNTEHRKVYREEGKCEVPGCGQELEEKEEGETPLQKRLGGLAAQISTWGTIAAVLIFIALVGSQIVALLRDAGTGWDWASIGPQLMSTQIWPLWVFAIIGALGLKVLSLESKKFWMTIWAITVAAVGFIAWRAGAQESVKSILKFFMVAVTIIVVAVPEGLPMAIFIALGLGMRKIRADNNLVRKMMAAETIGSATVICTDKTGTLTKNQMAVEEIYFRGKTHKGPDILKLKGTPGFDLLTLGCAVNSTANVEHLSGQVKFIGNPTEGALLVWMGKMGLDYQELRDSMPVHSRVCFTADRKMMTSITGNDACANCSSCPLEDIGVEMSSAFVQKDGCRTIFTKGAPERVLPLCKSVYMDEKTMRPIDESRAAIEQVVKEMAQKSIRPLAICTKVHRRGEAPKGDNAARDAEKDLVLLAIVGMTDPVREDVPAAIQNCGKAGIEVKMITGDHPLTAHAIADKIGMLKPGDIELTGDEFAQKTDAEIKGFASRLRVISRAKPVESKARLVGILQEIGEVVAVTGDGTNDAPALEKADVGISMGIKGTDVAKEASDIILTDDNFGSIVRAVHWGRTLYENLQKFLQFQLSINLSALGIALVSPIVGTLFPNSGFQIQPLTVLQYLWINLIMDTLAAIAFGLEPPRPEAMSQPPKNTKEPFLTKVMLSNIIVLGIYFIGLILFVQATDILGLSQYKGEANYDLMRKSLVFNCYIWFAIFHMFNARSIMAGKSAFANITRSRSFFLIMGFVIVMQLALVEFGGKALETAPLPFWVWVKVVALGASTVVVGEILRHVQRLFVKPAPAAAVTVAGII